EGILKHKLSVSCYTDAGYLTDDDDLKSQTGYVFVLNRGAVDWKSAKQSIFATSSAEAEYIAAFMFIRNPRYVLSAANLIHYLALRSLDVDQIKEDLSSVGLLNMETINPHVIASLSVGIQMLENLKSNSLDGDEIDKRSHIMVTVGEEAAANETFIHDTSESKLSELDLAGPKLRTGRMKEGPCVMKISPKRNIYGNVINPAQVWVAQKGAGPPPAHVSPDAVIYVDGQEFLKNLAVGDAVRFSDARGKQRFLKISKKFPIFTGVGFMANCTKTCYV
ncbi:plastidial pyruvate kinase 4, chloroplastic, partial [Tanacetum coccineum]